jgi:hypothetical protein
MTRQKPTRHEGGNQTLITCDAHSEAPAVEDTEGNRYEDIP